LKVCLVAWNLDIEKHAGVGRVGDEMYKGLVRRGHQVEVLALNDTSHGAYAKYLLWDIPRLLPPADVYLAQSVMESIWLPKNKTVTMVHDLIPLLYPKLAGANMNGNTLKTFLGSRFYWVGAHAACQSNRIIVNSTMTKNDILKTFPTTNPEKITVLKLGVRSDLDYHAKQWNIYRIGYIGQLDKRKRVNLLIEQFRKSQSKYMELVIGGTGPDRAKLERLASGDNRIKFLGFVPDDQLCAFYNSLDSFTFPSAVEGWGIPIVEAMACKIPVTIWHDAIIPDELKNRCQKGNIEDNYRFAHSCSWDDFADQLEKVLLEVVG
jgi:glycosyltransferase involved in cell wall biosynthesis